jgi:hypothetical protein
MNANVALGPSIHWRPHGFQIGRFGALNGEHRTVAPSLVAGEKANPDRCDPAGFKKRF